MCLLGQNWLAYFQGFPKQCITVCCIIIIIIIVVFIIPGEFCLPQRSAALVVSQDPRWVNKVAFPASLPPSIVRIAVYRMITTSKLFLIFFVACFSRRY